MPNRFYNTVNKNEEFGPGPNVVELPDTNLFFQGELAKGFQFTYDIDGIVDGTEAVPAPPVEIQIRATLESAGISVARISLALYSDAKGNGTALAAVDAIFAQVAIDFAVTEQEVRDAFIV